MPSPKKILLVHLYSNGDCLYATTIARQIKHDYPGCHLTWAIASFCKTIIANNPYVDEIMEVTDVKKDDVVAFRKFRKKILVYKEKGLYNEIFITHNIDTNLAFYDGSIRSGILRAYPNKITVPIKPVLKLYNDEINHAAEFAQKHNLQNYKHIILFEFAPQSKQLPITKEFAISIAEKLAENKEVAIILSSANKIEHLSQNIIDGSELSLRETAAVTHYCTLLLGCSSGITWIGTSDAAKQLPMVQLIKPNTAWQNSVSVDFKIFGLDDSSVIEIAELNEFKIVSCLQEAMENFSNARKKYTSHFRVNFKTTRNIIYNLLCYFEFAAIGTHIKTNQQVYGNNISFYKEVVLGIITAPFKLLKNFFTNIILNK
jgi:ADP-heptose:LPS heptosyltransferase